MQDLITLTSGPLTARFHPFGARLLHLSLNGGQNLVLAADPVAHPVWYACYPGAIVGPVANRITDGQVKVAGQTHQMPRNEGGATCLHSGPEGLHARTWQVAKHGADHVTFRCLLADDDCGLPGARDIRAQFQLIDATLRLTISATTDAATPMNIAHHPYWRLGNAADHRLMVPADHYLPVNARNLPTGMMASVANTGFDFRTPRALSADIDHNLCLSDAPTQSPQRVAVLTGTDGLRMQIKSTEPGLQVYAGAYLPCLPGTDIGPLAGIALEPQGWPDAPNQPQFPSVMITPETPYRQITEYCLDHAT
ncbi:aldose epimerase family protein [Tateyamaria sp.]|uniref:aldose epimerase family protein n=1 Tax=Tateyamaria sp. TaxID=1929288 RepID=UPI003B20F36F